VTAVRDAGDVDDTATEPFLRGVDARLARYRAHFDGAHYDAIVTPIIRRMLAGTRG